MNWFTKAQTTYQDAEIDDGCEHLREGDVYLVHTERDSFGPVKVVCLDCKEEVAIDDGCEHLREEDVCLVHTERDSFGPVGAVALCLDCEIARLKEKEEKKVVCLDCKEGVAKKDTIRWYWYDYYAPEDQDPLTICKECEIAPKHIQRVARDREMEAREFGYDD